ncbi:MAG TPA: hypothetical protein VF756_06655 [Thermoanaerobaculia bacterium]
MKTQVTTPDGHTIGLSSSLITGREVVTYDGQVVSKKTTTLYLSPHSFQVTEGGAQATYEVNFIAGWFGHGYIVRRNGIPIAHS